MKEYFIGLLITVILGNIISILFFKKYDKDWRNSTLDYMGSSILGTILACVLYIIIFFIIFQLNA